MQFTLREDIVKNRNGTKWNFLDALCTLREFIHCLLCSDYDLFLSLSFARSLVRSSPKCLYIQCTGKRGHRQQMFVMLMLTVFLSSFFIHPTQNILGISLSYYCQEAMIKIREKQNANATIVCDAITFSMVRIKIIVNFFSFFFHLRAVH